MSSGKKLVRSKSGLKIVEQNEENISPFHLKEPEWVPDNECDKCMSCQCQFTTFKRRHHCRRCGRCYCNSCTDMKEPLPRMCFIDPVRLCNNCGKKTQKENIFYNTHLKILMEGASFYVSYSSTSSSDNRENEQVCRLSNDQKFIKIESNNSNTDELINLFLIDNVQILTCGTDASGSTAASGLAIKYKESDNSLRFVKLIICENDKKTSLNWVTAMIKAFKLMFESRESGCIPSPTTPTTPSSLKVLVP